METGQLDAGLLCTLLRVQQWLEARDQMPELGDVVHEANGHVLRVADLKRLVDRLELVPEVNCQCHPRRVD